MELIEHNDPEFPEFVIEDGVQRTDHSSFESIDEAIAADEAFIEFFTNPKVNTVPHHSENFEDIAKKVTEIWSHIMNPKKDQKIDGNPQAQAEQDPHSKETICLLLEIKEALKERNQDQNQNTSDVMKLKEVAEYFKVTEATIRSWADNPKMKFPQSCLRGGNYKRWQAETGWSGSAPGWRWR